MYLWSEIQIPLNHASIHTEQMRDWFGWINKKFDRTVSDDGWEVSGEVFVKKYTKKYWKNYGKL